MNSAEASRNSLRAPPESGRLGEILLREGSIQTEDLEKALAFQAQYGGRIGSILVRIGAVAEDAMLMAVSRQIELPLITGDDLPDNSNAFLSMAEVSGIDPDWWIDQEILAWETVETAPDGSDEASLNCVARDPLSPDLPETVERAFGGRPVTWWLARNRDLDRALNLLREENRHRHRDAGDEISHLRELAEEAPTVELVSNTLAQAFGEGASDVHIEPAESHFDIRYRIDGVLQARANLSRERFDAVASRIKLIAGLDIAERRMPQDGRLSTRISGQDVEIRVSCLPGVWGESIVMRLLPKEAENYSLEALGMEEDHLAAYAKWILEPHGIILVTGPTGAGKSRTLYSTLEAINDGQSKIITVEDPVEYNVAGVTQVQAKAEIGFTFAEALRSILRQDPDKVMVGEIRDLETAEIGVRASLTGHMVFSTLHTNDAISAFMRLVDMGLEPFLVATSLTAVMAQRLIRRICPDCAQPDQPEPHVLALVKAMKAQGDTMMAGEPRWLKAAGCKKCQGTGYRGRTGIYELVSVTQEIRDAVLSGASTHELEAIGRTQGYRNLREDGLIKAWKGISSIDEIMRVTGGFVDE